MVNLLK